MSQVTLTASDISVLVHGYKCYTCQYTGTSGDTQGLKCINSPEGNAKETECPDGCTMRRQWEIGKLKHTPLCYSAA